MPNKQYKRGYRLELIAIKDLEREGYIAQRSAGSHGIDVIAFLRQSFDHVGIYSAHEILAHKEQPVIRCLMITCSDTKAKRKKDIEYLKDLPTIVSKELWVRKNGKWDIEVLEDE